MTSRLLQKYPKLEIAGIYSPPFGEMSVEEDQFVLDLIKSSHAQIVWVGLSTPKQEYWMRDHVARIPGATLIGVGAAFDFHSGVIARAPKWMQRIGLEWLHRMIAEPRRLWRRYLIMAPQFVWAVAMQEFKNFWNRSPGLRLRL
jgi:N-acetylglucosaminyldiphosphoundecaprenol N-acetyl-beta-D-mannosaminyltransferase